MRVRFERVAKAYGPSAALTGFDLDVEPGELMVLVGPSGSGKSTALRILAGLEVPDSGRVLIDDRDVTAVAPHRRGVSMVFQDFALYPHLDVRGNLAFGMRARREPAAEIARRTDAVARRLGLEQLMSRYPDQLSGGERQRVALARAMVREPAVYLMDEPLASLDAQLRARTRTEIVTLHQRLGTTTLYVTHDQAEAMTMADRLAVVAAGRVHQVGSPQLVYDEPATVFVAGFLGSPPMNLAAGGGVLGGPAGTTVGVRPEDLHLDDGAGGIDGADGIDGTVRAVEALGNESVLWVQARSGPVLGVRTGPRTPVRPSEPVRLVVDERRRHVFDADGVRMTSA